MIGRGAIANPFLFEMIKEDTTEFPEDRMEVFSDFLNLLLESYIRETQNDGNVLIKMKHYWEYFSESFENGKSYYRIVKRANSIEEYQRFIDELSIIE
jgi:tRNA-dihydrouridine synthase